MTGTAGNRTAAASYSFGSDAHVPAEEIAARESRPESVSIPRFRIPVNITRGA